MRRIFIDCGYHLGEGMNQFTRMLNINDSWEVYAFEPNPACDIENKIHQHPFKIVPISKAVWVDNTILQFNQEHQASTRSPTNRSTSELDGWGSCLDVLNSSLPTVGKVSVEAINFSEFLGQFRGHEVYCKFDIEGAEFSVIRKLVEDNTLSIIKHLWVEWHQMNLSTETDETTTVLQKEIMKHTTLTNWH